MFFLINFKGEGGPTALAFFSRPFFLVFFVLPFFSTSRCLKGKKSDNDARLSRLVLLLLLPLVLVFVIT